MAFICRIKQLRLNQLSHQFKRFYLGIPTSFLHNYVAAHSIAEITNKSNQFSHRRPIEFFGSVRFFAAPVVAKKPVSEPSSSEPRLNEQITAQFIRVVTDEGHSVMPKVEALQRARSLKLDLVEVDRMAKPPVCKIMDFNKERYKQQLKEKERAAKSKQALKLRKGDSKEIRFTPKTEIKDLQTKANMATRLMERGYRVRLVAVGNEDQDLGGLLARLSALIEDVAFVESGPRIEKKQAFLIARHVKFGPTKKGKKRSITEVLKTATSGPAGTEEQLCSEESEDEDDTTEVCQDGRSWSASAADEDFEEVFDVLKEADSHSDARMKSNFSPPVNASASEFSRPRMPNFMGANTNPSSSQPATQNRYQQNVARGPSPRDSRRFPNHVGQPQPGSNHPLPVQSTRRVSVDAPVSGNLRSHPQIPQQGAPNHRERYVPNGNVSVPPGGARTPGNIPNHREQYNSNSNVSVPPGSTRTSGNIGQPGNQVPKQEQPGPGRPASKFTDFGIFSTPKSNSSMKDSGAGHENRIPKSDARSQ